MREMKDSGIEWIADIPESWSVSKIESLYDLRITKVSDKDYSPLSVTNKGIVPQLETAAKTNAHDDRKLVCKGDFAINSRSDRRGSCGISAYTGSVSLINTILRPITEMNPQYYDWLFHTIQFGDEFYKWGHGIVDDLWTTGWQDMKKINIPTPPLEEQQKIADFLDEKCNEICKIIYDIQQQIETLEQYKRSVITEAVTKGLNPDVEMRDSGIEFIGKVPKHWEIRRMKTLGTVRNGLTYTPQDICDENEGTLVLRSSNVQNGKISLNDNVYVSCAIKSDLMVKYGDILICSRNGSRELIGKNAIIKNLNATFGAFMMIFRSESPEYLYYVLNSHVFSYYLGTFFTSTINQLTGFNFGNMKVAFCPNVCEQQKIVEYLDKKCIEIDGIITEKKQQIETIEEYKKSLIFEYVTGKKEIQI
ncbi:MAG: restriction endonuclease subunit S [Ruminococcus sp.]|nr:restriction endonuclease subunit S [Ruminococcus sp.]